MREKNRAGDTASQGQDRQPLSPEGAHPLAVRARRLCAPRRGSYEYVSVRCPLTYVNTIFVTLSQAIRQEISSENLLQDTARFLQGAMKASR
jgi:hypothetical protein